MALDPQYADAIKGFEGYSPEAKWDYKQNSNGYGTAALYPGEKIDEETANARFNDAIEKAQAHVESVAPNAPPGVKAALASLTYNAGPGWASSGLGDLVRAGDWAGAQERFKQYNKAGGQVNPGLVARRAKEAEWFTANPSASSPAAMPSAPPMGAPAPPQIAATPAVTQPSAPVPVSSQGMPAYGWSPNNAPAGISEAPQQAPQMAPPLSAPHLAPIQAAQRRTPDLTQLQAFLQRSPVQPGFFKG